MEAIGKFFSWFIGLGPTVMMPIVVFIIGIAFRAGWQRALRGGITVGIGLAGLFLVVDVIVNAMKPATEALAARLGLQLTLVDVNWTDCAVAWGWPGMAGVFVGIIIVNAIMILLRLTKTMWTDVWSYWHGQTFGAFVWALTGSLPLGILAGVLFLAINSIIADPLAKTVAEFNGMPGISVPCSPSSNFSLLSIPLNRIVDRIPVLKDIDASPEAIRKRFGIFGELSVLGAILGMIIGLAAGYNLAKILQLGMQVAVIMVLLPRMVGIISEGLVPVTQSVITFMRERYKGREVYVSVDCAVELGGAGVMESSIILYPLTVLLAAILPGNKLLPIASLSEIPFYAGAVAPFTKGNIVRTVLIVLILTVPVLYVATALAPVHTEAYRLMGMMTNEIAAGAQVASVDMGGDLLAGILIQPFRLFAQR